ncbi:MAG: hypothetical protein HGA45_02250 [Chloroflexales bacterium]|nr:hypothetical protein [Chloroflexales bacterium]
MTQQIDRQRRPRAATALGWLLIVQGLLALAIFGALLAVLLAVQTGALVVDLAKLSDPADRGPVLLSAGAGLAGVFSLVSGVGLLRLQAWAWLLALITQGVLLLVALIDYWLGSPDYLTLALGVVQVYLLNRSDVQQAIRAAGPHTAEALPSPPAAVPEPTDAV